MSDIIINTVIEIPRKYIVTVISIVSSRMKKQKLRDEEREREHNIPL